MCVLVIKAILFAIAAIWLLLTILAQFPFITEKLIKIYKYDKIYFFPVWTLFSPNPINGDYILLYRDVILNLDGSHTNTESQEFKLQYGFSIGNKGECAIFKNLKQVHKFTTLYDTQNSFLKNCREFYKIKFLISNFNKPKYSVKRQISCFVVRYNGEIVKKKLIFSYFINYK